MSTTGIQFLVDPLLRASRAKNVKWEVDPTGGYITKVGENSLNIYMSSGEDHLPLYTLRIVNKVGEVVDYVEAAIDDLIWSQLENIFSLARGSALNLDAIVEDILEHLSAGR